MEIESKDLIWYGILASLTIAYLIALRGVRAAQHHHITHHSRWMMIACSIVGLWLLGYVTKQVLLGRESFGGTLQEYWTFYIPVLFIHTSLAMVTIGLAIANLYSGFRRLQNGTGVGAMVAGLSQHRFLGRVMMGTFTGTIATAYVVYLMLFHWFRG